MVSGGKTTLCDYFMLFFSCYLLRENGKVGFWAGIVSINGEAVAIIVGGLRRKQDVLDERAATI